MNHTINANHPLLEYLKSSQNMTSLQREEYYSNNFHNKIYELIGNLTDVKSAELSLQVMMPPGPWGSGETSSINASYHYNLSLKGQLLNFNIGDLVVCNGNLQYISRYEIKFELLAISRFKGITDEENALKVRKENQRYWFLRGLIFLALTILFISIGGWWWIGAIISGIATILCFDMS